MADPKSIARMLRAIADVLDDGTPAAVERVVETAARSQPASPASVQSPTSDPGVEIHQDEPDELAVADGECKRCKYDDAKIDSRFKHAKDCPNKPVPHDPNAPCKTCETGRGVFHKKGCPNGSGPPPKKGKKKSTEPEPPRVEWLSNCCDHDVKVVGGDEETNHFVCFKCGEGCDAHAAVHEYRCKVCQWKFEVTSPDAAICINCGERDVVKIEND